MKEMTAGNESTLLLGLFKEITWITRYKLSNCYHQVFVVNSFTIKWNNETRSKGWCEVSNGLRYNNIKCQVLHVHSTSMTVLKLNVVFLK